MQLIAKTTPHMPAAKNSRQENHLQRLPPSRRSRAHSPPIKERSELISLWRLGKQTPFGVLRGWSSNTRATAGGSEQQNSFFAMYSSWLLSKLGVSYGLLIQGLCTDGWQYTIQPFNAVPDDALIFIFCSEGNIAAVRTLLTTVRATLRDRDSRGWTPLWYATKSLNLEVVEFLLEQGADIHSTDWKRDVLQ